MEIVKNEDKNTEEEFNEPEREAGELKETYTNKYGTVKIKNDTNIKLLEKLGVLKNLNETDQLTLF